MTRARLAGRVDGGSAGPYGFAPLCRRDGWLLTFAPSGAG